MRARAPRSLLFVVLALPVLLASPLAAAGRWTEIGPFGGPVLSLAVQPDDPDVLYAGTWFGVYKSVDRGAHWTLAGTPVFGNVTDLAVDPSRPFTVYAAVGGALRRSTDGGETWVATGAVAGARTLAVTGGGTVYVGTESGILASLDGGGSWLPRSEGLPATASVAAIAIDPARPETLYAGLRSGGVYKSDDGGARWRKAGSPLLDLESILDLEAAPADGRILYASTTLAIFRSQDGGETWTRLQHAFEAWALAVHRSQPDVIWAGTREGVLLSRDGGTTWYATASPSEFVAELVADPGDPAAVWAGTTGILARGGVYRSLDAGERWSFRSEGLAATDVAALAVDPRSPARLYAGLSWAVLRSHNRGLNWSLLPLRASLIRDVQVDPAFPSTVYVLGDEGLFRSSDRGDTWTHLWRFQAHGSHYSLRIDPGRPDILYAAVQGLHRSTDRGRRWTRLELPVPALFVDPLEIAPSSPSTLYALAWTQPAVGDPLRPHLLRSRDRGRSWVVVDPGAEVQTFAVDPRDSRTVYAFTDEGTFRTADGGGQWTLANDALRFVWPANPPDLAAVAGMPGTPTVFYLAYARTVFKSLDRGATWTPMTQGLTGFYELGELTPDPRKPGRLYLGLHYHGLAAFKP